MIHELVHINHFEMPFIQNELFVEMSKEKMDNKHLLETEEEKRQNDYLLKTKEIEAFFQSALIMFKKYKLIDSYNNVPTNIFTKLDERSDQILQKLEDEKDILSSEEKRLLIAEANFLSNYGEIIQYLINMLRINRNKNKEEPVELTEKDAIWLLKNLASVDDVDLPEESNVKNLMNNIRSSIIFLLAKNLPKEEGVEQYS